MMLSCRKRPSGSFLAMAYQVPANCKGDERGFGDEREHGEAAGLGGRGDRGHRAGTYPSLVEVLLDSEAAHPAVALRPGAAQRSQQHECPHPLHLAQESPCGKRAP